MLLGLNFVMLHVPDIEQARAFYTEKLGFVVEDQNPTFVQFKQNAGMGAIFALTCLHTRVLNSGGWWTTRTLLTLHSFLMVLRL